ncbi:MAG: clostripain-related cysteine peptidase [Candidatus Eremiobacteraeota bacterium]|nr:clostripain-related cysteine peptidase [Candidatus Eremiobacteraeota bacterium]
MMDHTISPVTPNLAHQAGLPPAALQGSEEAPSPQDAYEPGAPPQKPPHGSPGAPEGKEKEYVFLTYLDGSNNLEEYILDDLKEMESVPASEHYSVAAQFSRYHTSTLTAAFLGEALSQGFRSSEFRENLQEIVGDPSLIEKYGELLKDSSMCQRIATVLLRKNPALQDRLDRIAERSVREAAAEQKPLKEVIAETTSEMLGQIATQEKDRRNAQALAGQGSISTMSQGGMDLPSLLGDVLAATGDLIKKTGGAGPQGIELFSSAGARQAPSDPGRGSLLFLEPMAGEGKLNHGNYGSVAGMVDYTEVNNEPLWRGARRYEVSHDEDPSRINSKQVGNMGFRDMSKADTLADFIIWGMKKYPAKHYVVLMSDHGGGFLGAEEDRGSMMSLPDIRKAFDKVKEKTGKTPDIIAFDCCLMAQAEVAYELKDSAKYLVASEEVIGGNGYPYKTILPKVDKALSEGVTDPGDIARVFVEEAKTVNQRSTFTLSVIDLAAMEQVAKAADQLAGHILEGKADLDAVRASLRETQHYSVRSPSNPYDDFRDMVDMVDKLEHNQAITDADVRADLKNLREAVEKAVVAEQHQADEDFEGSHGMTVYAPRRQKDVSLGLMKEYEKTKMAEHSRWDELLKKLTNYDELEKKARGESGAKLTIIELPQRG